VRVRVRVCVCVYVYVCVWLAFCGRMLVYDSQPLVRERERGKKKRGRERGRGRERERVCVCGSHTVVGRWAMTPIRWCVCVCVRE